MKSTLSVVVLMERSSIGLLGKFHVCAVFYRTRRVNCGSIPESSVDRCTIKG
jgi:hypothetical protein